MMRQYIKVYTRALIADISVPLKFVKPLHCRKRGGCNQERPACFKHIGNGYGYEPSGWYWITLAPLQIRLSHCGLERLVTWCLVVINVDSVQLQVAVSMVGPSRVDAMFVAYNLPKLKEKNEQLNFSGYLTWISLVTQSCCSMATEAIISRVAK